MKPGEILTANDDGSVTLTLSNAQLCTAALCFGIALGSEHFDATQRRMASELARQLFYRPAAPHEPESP